MLNKDERNAKWESFLRKEYGLDPFMCLVTYESNIMNVVAVNDLYGNIVNWVAEDKIKLKNPESTDPISIRQHITLDIIMKIEILIETTLVLVEALSHGHKSIARTMTYYNMELVALAIKKIKERKYNMRRILSLPPIDSLPLSHEERKFMAFLYDEHFANVYRSLGILVDFYERFRIVYGKLKHGLMIQTGFNLGGIMPRDFSRSYCIAYDRKKSKKDLTTNYLISKRPKELGDFFNTTGNVTFNKKLIEEINAAATELRNMAIYLTENALLFVLNCGEPYLPYVRDNRFFWFYKIQAIPEDDGKMYEAIASRILPSMNITNVNFQLTNKYRDDLFKSLAENAVTNIWLEK